MSGNVWFICGSIWKASARIWNLRKIHLLLLNYKIVLLWILLHRPQTQTPWYAVKLWMTVAHSDNLPMRETSSFPLLGVLHSPLSSFYTSYTCSVTMFARRAMKRFLLVGIAPFAVILIFVRIATAKENTRIRWSSGICTMTGRMCIKRDFVTLCLLYNTFMNVQVTNARSRGVETLRIIFHTIGNIAYLKVWEVGNALRLWKYWKITQRHVKMISVRFDCQRAVEIARKQNTFNRRRSNSVLTYDYR